MYGTIARIKVRRDKIRELMALGKEWNDRERKRATGYLTSEVLWQDGEGLNAWLIVHFTSEDAYRRNADSPEQDAFYRRMRECFESDPEWFDGHFAAWDSPYGQVPQLARILEG